jgi:hypothetical protein
LLQKCVHRVGYQPATCLAGTAPAGMGR